MSKCRFCLIVLMLGVLVLFSVGATGGAPELKVQKALGVTEAPDVHKIATGSTIIHLPDGSTEITGPDGKSVISVKSSEVGLIPTPGGMAKATRVYEVPSGSFVHGASPNTIEIYDTDGKLILTVIDQAGEAGLKAPRTSPGAYPTYTGDGWIEWAEYGSGSYGHFYGRWTVPAAPVNDLNDDDTVYLWNGIAGFGDNEWADKLVLLQPVLEHNQDGLSPGNPLTGRVWVVTSGQYYRTHTIDVAVGNVVYGAVTLQNKSQPLWAATFFNQSRGRWVSLVTDLLGTTGQTVTLALEGWNLEPGNSELFGTTDFVGLKVRDQNGGTVYPVWQGWVDDEAMEEYFTGLDVTIHGCSWVTLHTDR